MEILGDSGKKEHPQGPTHISPTRSLLGSLDKLMTAISLSLFLTLPHTSNFTSVIMNCRVVLHQIQMDSNHGALRSELHAAGVFT